MSKLDLAIEGGSSSASIGKLIIRAHDKAIAGADVCRASAITEGSFLPVEGVGCEQLRVQVRDGDHDGTAFSVAMPGLVVDISRPPRIDGEACTKPEAQA